MSKKITGQQKLQCKQYQKELLQYLEQNNLQDKIQVSKLYTTKFIKNGQCQWQHIEARSLSIKNTITNNAYEQFQEIQNLKEFIKQQNLRYSEKIVTKQEYNFEVQEGQSFTGFQNLLNPQNNDQIVDLSQNQNNKCFIFWSSWCQPSQQIVENMVLKLQNQYSEIKGKFEIFFINCDFDKKQHVQEFYEFFKSENEQEADFKLQNYSFWLKQQENIENNNQNLLKYGLDSLPKLLLVNKNDKIVYFNAPNSDILNFDNLQLLFNNYETKNLINEKNQNQQQKQENNQIQQEIYKKNLQILRTDFKKYIKEKCWNFDGELTIKLERITQLQDLNTKTNKIFYLPTLNFYVKTSQGKKDLDLIQQFFDKHFDDSDFDKNGTVEDPKLTEKEFQNLVNNYIRTNKVENFSYQKVKQTDLLNQNKNYQKYVKYSQISPISSKFQSLNKNFKQILMNFSMHFSGTDMEKFDPIFDKLIDTQMSIGDNFYPIEHLINVVSNKMHKQLDTQTLQTLFGESNENILFYIWSIEDQQSLQKMVDISQYFTKNKSEKVKIISICLEYTEDLMDMGLERIKNVEHFVFSQTLQNYSFNLYLKNLKQCLYFSGKNLNCSYIGNFEDFIQKYEKNYILDDLNKLQQNKLNDKVENQQLQKIQQKEEQKNNDQEQEKSIDNEKQYNQYKLCKQQKQNIINFQKNNKNIQVTCKLEKKIVFSFDQKNEFKLIQKLIFQKPEIQIVLENQEQVQQFNQFENSNPNLKEFFVIQNNTMGDNYQQNLEQKQITNQNIIPSQIIIKLQNFQCYLCEKKYDVNKNKYMVNSKQLICCVPCFKDKILVENNKEVFYYGCTNLQNNNNLDTQQIKKIIEIVGSFCVKCFTPIEECLYAQHLVVEQLQLCINCSLDYNNEEQNNSLKVFAKLCKESNIEWEFLLKN